MCLIIGIKRGRPLDSNYLREDPEEIKKNL